MSETYADYMISLGLTNAAKGYLSQSSAEVLRALGETAAWCIHYEHRAADLRSSILDPHEYLNVSAFDSLDIETYIKTKRDSYQYAAESIKRKRSELLRDAAVQPSEPAEVQRLGRLLLYEAMETVSDGAAEASSHGFFDVEDAPAWDTWFWYQESKVFCWVPAARIPDAQAGIDANPVDCIRWMNWLDLSTLTVLETTA